MSFTLYDGREYMQVDEHGNIFRPAIGMRAPLGGWKILGAARFNNFGHQVEWIPFPTCAKITNWKYKNGKQKWVIVDLDHGTRRYWSSSAVMWENSK